jgi:hypothetical protein
MSIGLFHKKVKVNMRTQTISFPERQVLCVIPDKLEDLAEAIAGMGLENSHPVIVLLGGDIQAPQATATEQVIITLAKIAEDMKALVICGGVDTGVMAKIGQVRSKNQYQFPLVGITLEDLVSWPGGPRSTKLLWWGTKRWQLEPHYSHFILVPGSEPGDESPWVVEAATILSKGHPSVTILINGGELSRKDIELSIEHGRPVVALGGTGQLANDLAMEPDRNKLITVVPVHDESRLSKSIRAALSVQ